MFRPTHFVILFAVVLCATAFPADSAPGTPKVAGASPDPVQGPAGEDGVAAKGDLDTDATVHFGYAYWGPRWGYYSAPWGVKAYSWGPVWF